MYILSTIYTGCRFNVFKMRLNALKMKDHRCIQGPEAPIREDQPYADQN